MKKAIRQGKGRGGLRGRHTSLSVKKWPKRRNGKGSARGRRAKKTGSAFRGSSENTRTKQSLNTATESQESPSTSPIQIEASPESLEPISAEEAELIRQVNYDHPERYFTELLGISPWGKQLDIVDSIKAFEKTVVASCVSSGKSFIGGAIVPWWLTSHPLARVFIIAPTERQIKINLWGELTTIFNRSRIPLGGELLTLDWKLGDNWYAKGFSPKDALGVFGIHGPKDLFIFDDAQGISVELYDAFENASASGQAKYLFLCNPAVVSGFVYEAVTRQRKDINLIRIEYTDTPNIIAGHVVVPGLLITEKAEQWIKKYGWDSDFVRVKLRALPPKQEPDTLIPIDWLEAAVQREIPEQHGPIVLGVDIARFGNDQSILCASNARQMLPIPDEWVMQGYDTMRVTGMVVRAIKELEPEEVFLDVIGVGGGPVDRLHEMQNERPPKVDPAIEINGVNVGEKAFAEDEFVNLRSEAWWAARESLDPDNMAAMALVNDPELIGDLSSIKYKVRSDGRIEVESKEETKKRLGHSPDKGDAYVMMVFKRYLTRAAPVGIQEKRVGLPRRPAWLR